MITSRLMSLTLETRSSSLALPSGLITDLSKSKNASVAWVTLVATAGAGVEAEAVAGVWPAAAAGDEEEEAADVGAAFCAAAAVAAAAGEGEEEAADVGAAFCAAAAVAAAAVVAGVAAAAAAAAVVAIALSQPAEAVAGVQLALRQQCSLLPFFQASWPEASLQLSADWAPAAAASVAEANNIATLFSFFMVLLFGDKSRSLCCE